MMRDTILHGDCLARLRELPAESVQCIVTSPPYFGLRDYGTGQWVGGSASCDHDAAIRDKALAQVGNSLRKATDHPGQINMASAILRACPSCGATRQDAQIGLEETPDAYVAKLVEVFREARRVLRSNGTLWLNLGDSFSSGGARHTGRNDENEQDIARRAALYRTGKEKATATPQERSSISTCAGVGSKQLLGMPWRVAFALQADGWILRSDVIWAKPNCMPESVKDRPTKAHEYLFLFAKSERYYYDSEALREEASPKSIARISGPTFHQQTGGPKDYRNGINPNRSMRKTLENFAKNPGRNKRTVWTIATSPYKQAHFATFPPALVEPCILAGSRAGDLVLDPFMGAGTVGMVAKQHGRSYLGIELNASYIALAEARIAEATKPRAKILKLPKRAPVALQASLWEVTA